MEEKKTTHPSNREEPAAGTEQVYDRQRALRLTGGNRKLADDLLVTLQTELPDHRETLHAALATGDQPTLRDRAHKIHGGAMYCSVPALCEAARGLEQALANGDPAAIRRALHQVDQEIERVMALQITEDIDQ